MGAGHGSQRNKKVDLRLGVSEYQQLMKRINWHGIAVLGRVIYGWDADAQFCGGVLGL
jgi:hypothetical protein